MNIEVKNVSKSFGDKRVLHKFSAVVREHMVTSVMGPSGCGKTTLLNLMMNLLSSDSGEVTGIPANRSAVFQEDRLCEDFSAVANVRLVCPNTVKTSAIEKHLLKIGLGDSMHEPVSKLSGGMRRRVAVVRAIMADRDIIFMDEPFKGLDIKTKRKVIQYVKDYIVGKTVVMVTHDESEAREMGGDLIFMGMEQKLEK